MRILSTLLVFLVASPCFAATCKINEYASLVEDSNGNLVPVAEEPSATTQSVTFSTSTQSAAFSSGSFVRIICDSKAHFRFGTSPTATADDSFLAADSAEYFGIGGFLKVAFYDGES